MCSGLNGVNVRQNLQPSARVVRRERNCHPAATGESGGVAAGRSVPVQDGAARVVDAPSLADDEVIVAVEMHGVRDRGGALHGLDQPVVPLAIAGGRDDVQLGWVVGVAIHQVFESGCLPVDVDGRCVDGPDDHGVAVRLELGLGEVDVHRLVDERSGRNGLLPVRCQICWLSADVGLAVGAGCWGAGRDSVVGPDSLRIEAVATQAIPCNIRAEPVVARSLVGVDDNVVTLANGKENPFSSVWLDGDEVGGHDLHWVVVKRDTNVVVNGDVDQPETVLLALLDSNSVVFATASCVLVGAVDEDVVTSRARTSVLKCLQGEGIDLVSGSVVPVVDHVRTQVEIVVGRCGTIEHNRRYTCY